MLRRQQERGICAEAIQTLFNEKTLFIIISISFVVVHKIKERLSCIIYVKVLFTTHLIKNNEGKV